MGTSVLSDTKKRNIFYLVIILLIAAIIGIAVFLYYDLRSSELSQTRSEVKTLCGERANSLLNTLRFATISLQGFAGYIATSNADPPFRTTLSSTEFDFATFYNFSQAASNLDTVLFLPYVSNADRPGFELKYNATITAANCASNPTKIYNATTCNATALGYKIPYVIGPMVQAPFYFPVLTIYPPVPAFDFVMYDFYTAVAPEIDIVIQTGKFLAGTRAQLLGAGLTNTI